MCLSFLAIVWASHSHRDSSSPIKIKHYYIRTDHCKIGLLRIQYIAVAVLSQHEEEDWNGESYPIISLLNEECMLCTVSAVKCVLEVATCIIYQVSLNAWQRS